MTMLRGLGATGIAGGNGMPAPPSASAASGLAPASSTTSASVPASPEGLEPGDAGHDGPSDGSPPPTVVPASAYGTPSGHAGPTWKVGGSADERTTLPETTHGGMAPGTPPTSPDRTGSIVTTLADASDEPRSATTSYEDAEGVPASVPASAAEVTGTTASASGACESEQAVRLVRSSGVAVDTVPFAFVTNDALPRILVLSMP